MPNLVLNLIYLSLLKTFTALSIMLLLSLSHEFLITGDFSIHVINLFDNYSQQLLSILSHTSML
jgi:hypothetical protein